MGRSIRKQHSPSTQERKASQAETVVIPILGDGGRSTIFRGKPGRLLRGMVQFPYTFVAMNWAAVVGLYAFLRNRKDVWVRSSDPEAWEGVMEPIASLPPVQSADSARKAA